MRKDTNKLLQPAFFRPNTKMVKWLADYAGKRIIMDCGSGEKFILSQQLLSVGFKKIVAIDLNIDYREYEKMRILDKIPLDASFHVLFGEIEKYKDMYNTSSAAEKILMVFARPCHSDWVEKTLDARAKGIEALYITVPENLEKYNDLGKWKKKAKLLQHEGSSADKEVVYSIK